MGRALLAVVASAALTLAAGPAEAAPSDLLAAPRLFLEAAAPRTLVTTLNLFTVSSILDLRAVQADPVMRARRDYSLMTALPVVKASRSEPLPLLGATQQWNLSRTVRLTFPLAITGRNLVTAEIAGAGQLAVAATGLASGGVFTFTGAF